VFTFHCNDAKTNPIPTANPNTNPNQNPTQTLTLVTITVRRRNATYRARLN